MLGLAPGRGHPSLGLVSKLVGKVSCRLIVPTLLKRAAASGLNADELAAVLKQAKNPAELASVLEDVAFQLYERGRYWDELGLKPRASEFYAGSALWSFYAQLLATGDPARQRALYLHCALSYRLAAPHFGHPAYPVAIAYQSGSLSGYLRLPRRAPSGVRSPDPSGGRLPVVVLLNALNSSKEELHYTENAFLNLGMATVSFDYPGTADSDDLSLPSLDPAALGNAISLFLASTDALDAGRVSLYGVSFGGALAITMASLFPDRFRAVASLSATTRTRKLPFLYMPGARLKVERLIQGESKAVSEVSHCLPGPELIAGMTSAFLLAGGGKDPVVPAAETRLVYEQSGSRDKKLLMCPRASHNCYEMMPSLRYEIANWIRQRV